MFGSHAVRRNPGAATAAAWFLISLPQLALCTDRVGSPFDEGIMLSGGNTSLRATMS